MADDADESEKTEDPSQRKLDEAIKRGEVAKSQEVNTWFMMLGSTFLFAILAPNTSASLLLSLKRVVANADQFDLSGPGFADFFSGLAWSVLGVALIPMALLAVMALMGNLIQHRLLFTTEPLAPKLSRISPVSGAKRLFSQEALVNFVKGLIKLSVVAIVMFVVLWPERDRLETMVTAEPLTILGILQELAVKLFGATLAVVTLIAGLDFLYQRQRWWTRQKMTVKEVRDEFKNAEGDPHIKGKLRQLRQERGRKRMMASVPEASVVITNPTHFAVALKYDPSMSAPVCLAKGADNVAFRIREVAKENDVPIVENPPLARALYASVEIEETIPIEHFKAVAQVIGYVMRLKQRPGWRSKGRN